MTAMTDHEHAAVHMQVGALARATGLSVRTLHHYDAIGLLVPDGRSLSGRRLYSERNVTRLYRITALRRLGLRLDQIHTILDRDPDLIDTVRRHLAHVEHSLERQLALQRTLRRMLERLEQRREPTLDQLTHVIEEITMSDQYYAPEQQEQLTRRRDALGEEGMRRAERQWADLIDAVEAARAAGTPPSDPGMRELARRWRELIEQFTGGDEGIRQSLATMYREQGPKAASRGSIDPELMEYVGRALAALDRAG
jgi:DNA-binding transcriptional MerR regulator